MMGCKIWFVELDKVYSKTAKLVLNSNAISEFINLYECNIIKFLITQRTRTSKTLSNLHSLSKLYAHAAQSPVR